MDEVSIPNEHVHQHGCLVGFRVGIYGPHAIACQSLQCILGQDGPIRIDKLDPRVLDGSTQDFLEVSTRAAEVVEALLAPVYPGRYVYYPRH